MMQLEELVSKGPVEWRTLGEVLAHRLSCHYAVKSTDYNSAYPTPVLTAGQTFVLGYTDETEGICEASPERPVIIFDDFKTAFRWVDFPFKVKSSAMKMLWPRDVSHAGSRYLYYAMQEIRYVPRDHRAHWLSVYAKFSVPVPPLAVQQEIVRILDTFSELEGALQDELRARRKQYEYYRKRLLTFGPDEVEWATLGDIGPIRMCGRVFWRETSPEGDVPFYKVGTLGRRADAYISRALYEEYRQRYPYPRQGEVLLSVAGTIGRMMVYDGEPAYFQDSNVVWISNDESRVLNRFLYYYYQATQWKVDDCSSIIARLYHNRLAIYPVPIPPKEVQQEVVRMLDVFTEGEDSLRAELEDRRRQYAYYRRLLLSFPRPEGGGEG